MARVGKVIEGKAQCHWEGFHLETGLVKSEKGRYQGYLGKHGYCCFGVFYTESPSENGVFHLLEKNHLLVHKSTSDWEDAWTRLKQISDMTEQEFNSEWDKLDQEESDEDAESDEEDFFPRAS